jgi:hypothetical protein
MDAREVSVLQLQLLRIRTEDAAVPMDATARTELIDLMARFDGGLSSGRRNS